MRLRIGQIGPFAEALFAFRTSCCSSVAASLERLSYGAGVIKAPSMLNRPILVRGAFIGLLLVGLIALADGIVRKQLQQAAREMATLPATEAVQITGAIR